MHKPKDQQLTLLEWLNIDCDAHPAQLPKPPIPDTNVHPEMLASYPHICVSELLVICCLQYTLWDAATQATYFNYLQDKFQWNSLPSNTIQWQILQLTLQCFTCPKCKNLTKFIHEWLPLQDCYHIQCASTLHQCPSCHSHSEMVQNFLACPHPDCIKIWEEMHQHLLKHCFKHDLQANYHEILTYGLQQGHQTPILPDPCLTFLNSITQSIMPKTNLGGSNYTTAIC